MPLPHSSFSSAVFCFVESFPTLINDILVSKVTYIGFRDFESSFRDKRKQFLRSKDDWLEVCLSLLPVTNYTISITAVSARFTASITTCTSLTGITVQLSAVWKYLQLI